MAQRRSAKRDFRDVHGIVLLDKPKGISSNAALQKVRHLFKANKAGHTGNLDPMATGLLPCCFGDATKVAALLINSDKTYRARCVLGTQTDTGDATGEVIGSSALTAVSDHDVLQAAASLTGEIKQIPPMYSALHHEGQRLYDLARKGITVERPSRKVTVYDFKLLCNRSEFIDFEIKVSKGTYIRTLLEDLAVKLGTVAHMSALHRIQTGIFSADGMHTLEELAAMDDPMSQLLPMEQALVEYPRVDLTAEQTQDLIHGKRVKSGLADQTCVMFEHHGLFFGLGVISDGQLRVKNIYMKSYQQQLKSMC
ncbi:tRNA pseudouridine(55) synthase TruB [Marinicella sediminis]|uniref:tRNA pseudouridine synthase B n=1 Tax=Marinicella sediminis TaxID=1792834 RepID=A0ABV7JCZ9_9GAMM|nr:tRNA pseudouridine(55) synthase TruB [Marinicella sediminis]